MPKQKRLKGFAIAKGQEYKGKLPKQYLKLKHVLSETKFDGLRGIIIVRKGTAKAYTSTGVLVPNASHLCKLLSNSIADMRMYDGEFFVKNWNLTQGIVKTQKKHPKRKLLCIRLFDCVALSEWDNQIGITPLDKRKRNLLRILKKLKFPKQLIYTADVPIEPTDKEIKKYMHFAKKAGHEGVMIKDPTAPYAFKRSANWLKLKPKRESDLKIVDVKLGTEGLRHEKTLGRLWLEGIIDGVKVRTKVGSGFTDAERKKYWKMHKQGKLIGKVVMIEHEGLTAKKAVRFPEFIRFHAEK
jgi:ATP-dependent DNA ligase